MRARRFISVVSAGLVALTGTVTSAAVASPSPLFVVPSALSTIDEWKAYNQQTEEYAKLFELLSSPDPIRWLFTGDSITHGVVSTGGYRTYSELFDNHPKTTEVRGVSRTADAVMNTGVANGDTRQMSQ